MAKRKSAYLFLGASSRADRARASLVVMEDTELSRKVHAHRTLPPPAMRKALREAAGLTQEDLARALGVRRESVSRYEHSRRRPRGRLLIAYAELLEDLRRV